jgi:competence protein ComEC
MPLKVHFLNVGRGDCTIIEFPSGRVGMVDIDYLKVLDRDTRAELLQEYRESMNYLLAKATGRTPYQMEESFLAKEQAKLTDPFAYYDTYIGEYKDIFRLFVTHPDMDHMTGLYRLHEPEPKKAIVNFWHTGPHDFNLAETTDEDWASSPYDKKDWQTYRKLRRSETLPKSLQKYQGDTGSYWTEDGVEIWAPTPDLEKLAVEKDEPNVLSMVLKISHAGRSIVLGGDATADDTWPVIYQHLDLSSIDVLKASHHGRKTGYYGPAVKEMSPWLTITSVGEKEHDATENYRRYSTHTVSLRRAGDIRITINDDGRLLYSPNVADHWKSQST